MTTPLNVIDVLHQYKNFNGLSKNIFTVSALTQIHPHQVKALLLKDKTYQQKKNQKVVIMLTWMNSKKKRFHHLNYQMSDKYLISKTTFSRKANLMKYPV